MGRRRKRQVLLSPPCKCRGAREKQEKTGQPRGFAKCLDDHGGHLNALTMTTQRMEVPRGAGAEAGVRGRRAPRGPHEPVLNPGSSHIWTLSPGLATPTLADAGRDKGGQTGRRQEREGRISEGVGRRWVAGEGRQRQAREEPRPSLLPVTAQVSLPVTSV